MATTHDLSDRQRITIAILALGGQGGGVLADWIAEVGRLNGCIAQATSVPGVAQRTGSTVYYVELFRGPAPAAGGPEPVLALMPAPGDVDIVIASELMEAGRAVLRGFVTPRTTLIGSTHRIYAIGEKSSMGDGRASSERILTAARERSGRFIGFDMDEVASRCGSVISSVMFGALAGSGALPFPRESFEAAIRAGGKAVESNLGAFAAGVEGAQGLVAAQPEAAAVPEPTSATGERFLQRIRAELPESAQPLAIEGVKRLMDYQDAAYADLYLDRLAALRALDEGLENWRLTREAARHLALRMSYEDTIRVADLKVRGTRFERVRDEVRLRSDQLLAVTEYMHPRLEEICETLPAGLGRWLLGSKRIAGMLSPFFQKGRHVTTTKLRWFLVLSMLAGMRRWRRGTLRYRMEEERIERWIDLVRSAGREDPRAAIELVESQRLIKGYGDTFERGLRNYETIAATYEQVRGRPDAAAIIRKLREAALADDEGLTLGASVAELKLAS
jgi:indolepyruvate ferredoxin oxidoreductase, beta subunit